MRTKQEVQREADIWKANDLRNKMAEVYGKPFTRRDSFRLWLQAYREVGGLYSLEYTKQEQIDYNRGWLIATLLNSGATVIILAIVVGCLRFFS